VIEGRIYPVRSRNTDQISLI